jgi:hypothetical protein
MAGAQLVVGIAKRGGFMSNHYEERALEALKEEVVRFANMVMDGGLYGDDVRDIYQETLAALHYTPEQIEIALSVYDGVFSSGSEDYDGD